MWVKQKRAAHLRGQAPEAPASPEETFHYRRVPGQAVAGHVAMCRGTANNFGYLGLVVVAIHFVVEKRARGRVYKKQDKCLPLQATAEEYAPSACLNQMSTAKTHLKTILVKTIRTREFEHRIGGSVL